MVRHYSFLFGEGIKKTALSWGSESCQLLGK